MSQESLKNLAICMVLAERKHTYVHAKYSIHLQIAVLMFVILLRTSYYNDFFNI